MSKEFTQGVCGDGSAFIRNGKMLTIEEVLKLLNTGTHDAYRGARQDLSIWKERALDAEHKLKIALEAVNEMQGPTFMGEPVLRNLKKPSKRIIDLAERLVAAGPKAAHVSASECHEIRDFIIGLQP